MAWTWILQDDSHPVVMVSWNDAMAYVKWLGHKEGNEYRLPTEAEWEYAARSGGKRYKYSWGNGGPEGNIAGEEVKRSFPKRPWPIWERYDDGYIYTAPVGSFKPNEIGLYDMAGNVWEWVGDWYNEKYYEKSPRDNPKGPLTGELRVLRGGSWTTFPGHIRVAYRNWSNPDNRLNFTGFRLALSAR